MDFTLEKYKELLLALKASEMRFSLRHDVDLRPQYSLRMAVLEHEMRLQSTYYFRIVKESNNPEVIRQIVELGHEIGYHYEDLTLASGDVNKAYTLFQEHLSYFRQFYPVKKVCMHGSPRSQYDSRDLWKKYDYHALDINYEPYLDEDYSTTFYLTDTGRCWDGYNCSRRDKIPVFQDQWIAQGLVFHSTDDIIDALKKGTIQELNPQIQRLLLTTHPQRWSSNPWAWTKELCTQNMKNIIKRILIKSK